jgi:glycosyltransferase involved in cell wall biosynthesis
VFGSANVTLVPMPQSSGLVRLGWQLAWLRRRHHIDLLHVQYRLPLWPLGACACTIHDTLFETHPAFFSQGFVRLSRFTSRRAVRDAALLFSVSRFSRDEIARLYGIDAQHITVTGNGVDTARFFPGSAGAEHVSALGLAPGAYLCTVGRLEPRKNHVNLLRAYALLPLPRPPLVIIGQRDFSFGAVFEEIERLGLDTGPQGELRLLERVDDAALPALLRHALLFVYPSFAEGFGMPVAEAMASGVAVVTSNTTALPEVAGDAALTADPTQPQQMAQAILTLLQDPARRAQAVRRGRLQAARFNWHDAAVALVGQFCGYFGLDSAAAPTRTTH